MNENQENSILEETKESTYDLWRQFVNAPKGIPPQTDLLEKIRQLEGLPS